MNKFRRHQYKLKAKKPKLLHPLKDETADDCERINTKLYMNMAVKAKRDIFNRKIVKSGNGLFLSKQLLKRRLNQYDELYNV